MKMSFEVTEYYKNNKKISKAHGVLFMLFGFIVLGFLVYELSAFAANIDETARTWTSGVDCSNYPSLPSTMNGALNEYNSDKSDYQKIKSEYYNASSINAKVELFGRGDDKINALINSFNNVIGLYNNNQNFYDVCYNAQLSSEIESMRSYITREESERENEFKRLKPEAEAAGYVYSAQ